MKIKILLLVFFLNSFTFIAVSQKIQVTLSAGIDTINNNNKRAIFNLWIDYLNSQPDSIYNNPYWNEIEKQKYTSFDLINSAGFLSPSLYGLVHRSGKNVVLSITPLGDSYQIKSMFYFPYTDKSIYPLAIVNYIAKMEEGNYKLSNFLSYYTNSWRKIKVGYFNYFYHSNHPFDIHKANEANDYYIRLSKLFEINLDTLDYYIAENCDKIFTLQGFDFVVGIGSENNLCGFYDFNNNIIYSNTIAGEDYRHEITHSILSKFPNSGIFHLGIVTYWGGENAHFNKTLNFHIKRVNDYLKNHPEINLNNFIENFSQLDEFTSPHYIIAAIFCHIAIEQGGINKLKKLFSYGNENIDSYRAIETEFGIKRNAINKYLRQKIEFYATQGLDPKFQ